AHARGSDVKPTPEALEYFEKSVRPVLAGHCQSCHGADKQKGGLRLDSRDAMLNGGDSGPVIVPGEPEKSKLITAVHQSGDAPKMPPKGKLDETQIVALTNWIKQGAPWPAVKADVRPSIVDHAGMVVTAKDREFWSFRPVAEPPVPQLRNPKSEIRNEIDAFIQARLEKDGLTPSPPADKRTLIRRVTFDLTGLPPSPEEVEAYLRDDAADAYDRLVDRLLASPHYGERWARHWLDIARYGEDQAHTFQSRKYPQGFRYRDWLVKSFNDDLRYDRFVMEQIAADLLEGPDRNENLPALGYFSCGPVYYGDQKKLDQYDDRIDTLSRGFLGLTVACARCHDHKFDPIPTADYYSLAGIFASTEYDEFPLVPPEEVEKAKKALTDKQKKDKVAPKYPLVHALKDLPKPVTMRVHVRGNPDTLGPEAPHHFLTVLTPDAPPKFEEGSGRLELAKAIADPANPLTARVFVNRVWKHHFGQGLVRTASNFGALGERPTHPELLDHLATQFVRSGWSIKALHRLIVMSATYRQTSATLDERNREIDPENRLAWRMNRRRLEVEAWRDAMLAAAGTLDRTLGGPSTDLNSPDNRRRTFYGSVSRHDLNPLLRLFDFPDPNITADKRPETTVPLQQLFVLNSEFMVRNAKALAGAVAEAERDDAERIKLAFLRLYGRPATEREVSLGLAFVSSPSDDETLTRWEQYAQALLAANEFLYVD
ncbi:MAG TPA: PSD1 and planctomycete cytochrome C domain-containing protein, partial [Gemmataceae bacterium]|nr:PSD1 and planctomycete cytochrome C domain-containing protein [Gemmataceae bacterium]